MDKIDPDQHTLHMKQLILCIFKNSTKLLFRSLPKQVYFTLFLLHDTTIYLPIITPDRRQIKNFNTINKHRLKIIRNSVSNCHLSPDWRQMAIENHVSFDFYPWLSIVMSVFDCRLSCVIMHIVLDYRK